MFMNKRASTVPIVILILMAISSSLLPGCQSKNSVKTPNFSIADGQVLTNAYNKYTALKATLSPEQARQQLIQQLSTENGVAKAELGQDGYSIFVTYADGNESLVDTYNDADYQATETGETPDDNFPDIAATGVNGSAADSNNFYFLNTDFSLSNTGISVPSYSASTSAATPSKVNATSKKVLILAPIGPEFGVVTASPSKCVTYLESHGWSASDITIDENDSSTPPGCFNVTPEDYFNLSDYGIILFFGHGDLGPVSPYLNDLTVPDTVNVNDNTQVYLQFANVSMATFNTDAQLQQWRDQKQILVGEVFNTGGTTWYSLFIRGDLLQQKMGKLPNSYVQLATCFGAYFHNIFIDDGAGMFMGWDNVALSTFADDNQNTMVNLMLGDNLSAIDAYSDSSITKNVTLQEYVAAGTAPESLPGSGPLAGVHFVYYPSSQAAYYLPAWVEQVKVNNVPENASTVKVSLFNSHSVLLKSNTVPGNSTAISVSGFDKFLFPATDKITIQIDTYDKDNKVITTQKYPVTLNTGSNSIEMNIGGYTWYLSGGEEGINFEAGSSIEMSQSSELDVYVNGVLINTVKVSDADPGLYPAPINIQANTGDTLRLVFHCDWNQPFSHYTQWLGELWITRADDFSDVVQLTKKQDFGSNDDGLPKKEITFDESFVLPKFPLTSTTLLPVNTSTNTP